LASRFGNPAGFTEVSRARLEAVKKLIEKGQGATRNESQFERTCATLSQIQNNPPPQLLDAKTFTCVDADLYVRIVFIHLCFSFVLFFFVMGLLVFLLYTYIG